MIIPIEVHQYIIYCSFTQNLAVEICLRKYLLDNQNT